MQIGHAKQPAGITGKPESESKAEEGNKSYCPGDKLLTDTIYLLKSKAPGAGSDEPGKILMRWFIFALKEMDSLPAKMVFMNSAIYLYV